MAQTKLIARRVASIGEEIGLELGTQMVKGYQQSNPSDVHSYLIGRNIIDHILAQPGCVGIKFYNAFDEKGIKTLVYIGVDIRGNGIVKQSVVTSNGDLGTSNGIVADRSTRPDCKPNTHGSEDNNWWLVD